MMDPRQRVSRPLAMLSVVLLLTLAFAPTTLAAPADDDRPSISFELVLNFFAGLMQNAIDASSGVIDANGQPAPAPAPPAPTPPAAPQDAPPEPGTESGGVIDANG